MFALHESLAIPLFIMLILIISLFALIKPCEKHKDHP